MDGFFWEFYINSIRLSGSLPFSEDKLLFFQYCQSSFNRHLAFVENFCQCFNCKVNEYMTICIWPALIFLGKSCPVEQDNIKFFPFSCFQIRISLCAVVAVKIIYQCKRDYLTVGFKIRLSIVCKYSQGLRCSSLFRLKRRFVLRILFCMVYPLLFSYWLIQQVVPVWYCFAVR